MFEFISLPIHVNKWYCGIIRKRFSRELNHLKKCADYSCVDRHGVVTFLNNIDQKCYAYNLILEDMSPDFMKN